MIEEPYLIAHLVRGEPAFDIAIKAKIGEEEGWIIPTSGHRARPYAWFKLADLIPEIWNNSDHPCKFPPVNWPDHYQISTAKGKKPFISHLDLEELGL